LNLMRSGCVALKATVNQSLTTSSFEGYTEQLGVLLYQISSPSKEISKTQEMITEHEISKTAANTSSERKQNSVKYQGTFPTYLQSEIAKIQQPQYHNRLLLT
jgi:hypothetical protein